MKSGFKTEVTYDLPDGFNPYHVKKEERYRMRNIPFFVIPPCESKAFDPSKIKSKIDTHNSSYHPPKPRPRSFTDGSGAVGSKSRQDSAWSSMDKRSSSLGSKDLSQQKSSGYGRQNSGTNERHRTPPGQAVSTGKRSSSLGAKDLSYRTPRNKYLGAVKRGGSLDSKVVSRATPRRQSSDSEGRTGRELFRPERSPLQKSARVVREDEASSDLVVETGEVERVDSTDGSVSAGLTEIKEDVSGKKAKSNGATNGDDATQFSDVEEILLVESIKGTSQPSLGSILEDGEERVASERPRPFLEKSGSDSIEVCSLESKQAHRGPAAGVGRAAQVAWSESGVKKERTNKISKGKIPDYSHVKPRISTRRSPKTTDPGKDPGKTAGTEEKSSGDSVAEAMDKQSGKSLGGSKKNFFAKLTKSDGKRSRSPSPPSASACAKGAEEDSGMKTASAQKSGSPRHSAEKAYGYTGTTGTGRSGMARFNEAMIPSYGIGPANRFANIKSKVDQSDPNPAHKLQHSLEDLTIDSKQGREINPRFSGVKYSHPKPLFQRGQTIDYSEFPRSGPVPERHRIQKSASMDTPTGPSHSKFMRKERAFSPPKMCGIAKKPKLPATYDVLEETEEDELQSETSVPQVSSPEPKAAEKPGKTKSGIYGMDVTNTGTETTVVLKHIFGDKKASKSSDMAIIEEDEESFYESEDTPLSPSHSSFSLSHPIPRLIVTDPNGELVQTVVENIRDYTPTPSTGASAGSPSRPVVPIILVEEEEGESTGL